MFIDTVALVSRTPFASMSSESGEKLERNLSHADIKSVFSEEAVKASQKISVVSGEMLDISLNDFAALFIADNAPYSYKRYNLSSMRAITCLIQSFYRSFYHDAMMTL